METQAATEATLPIHFQLIDVWQRTLGTSVDSITDDFFELGGHSLLVARLLDEIEAETGRRLPVAKFLQNPTIAGCTAALLSEDTSDTPLVCVQEGDGGVPLIFFHGDILGGGFYVRRLMKYFGPSQRLFVMAPLKVSPEQPLPTIEEIAAHRADLIQSEIPHGPYLLTGFCIGGVVCYETARQLAARGEEVKAVVMIDPEIGSRTDFWCQRLVNWLGERKQISTAERVQQFMTARRKLCRLRQLVRSSFAEKRDALRRLVTKRRAEQQPATDATDSAMPDSDVLDCFEWMTTAYRPRRYTGRVKLLYTEDQLEATPHLINDWRKAAPQLRSRKIPGRHLTAITTYGKSLVGAIRAELRGLYMLSLSFCEFLPEFLPVL